MSQYITIISVKNLYLIYETKRTYPSDCTSISHHCFVDWIVSSLLHDNGDIYAPFNHDEFAATILRPFVREQCTWVVEKHGDFQMIYYAQHVGANPNKRDLYKDHPYFEDCVNFCERWDQTSLDPNYDCKPLDFFVDMVSEVFDRKPYDPQIIRSGIREPLVIST